MTFLAVLLASFATVIGGVWAQSAAVMNMPQITKMEVQCAKDGMKVDIDFDIPFEGIIFSKGHFSDPACRYVAANSNVARFSFLIPMQGCGTTNASTSGNTFSNVVVIQNDAIVQEIWDSAQKLTCQWTESLSRTVSVPPITINMLEATEARFNADDDVVDVWMDMQLGLWPNSSPVNGPIRIGETLSLIVGVNDPTLQMDLQVRDCYAHSLVDVTDPSALRIQLTDNEGCVLKPKLLSPFQRQYGDAGDTVNVAHLNAFSFPDNSQVFTSCNVEVCKDSCEPNSCQPSKAKPLPPKDISTVPTTANPLPSTRAVTTVRVTTLTPPTVNPEPTLPSLEYLPPNPTILPPQAPNPITLAQSETTVSYPTLSPVPALSPTISTTPPTVPSGTPPPSSPPAVPTSPSSSPPAVPTSPSSSPPAVPTSPPSSPPTVPTSPPSSNPSYSLSAPPPGPPRGPPSGPPAGPPRYPPSTPPSGPSTPLAPPPSPSSAPPPSPSSAPPPSPSSAPPPSPPSASPPVSPPVSTYSPSVTPTPVPSTIPTSPYTVPSDTPTTPASPTPPRPSSLTNPTLPPAAPTTLPISFSITAKVSSVTVPTVAGTTSRLCIPGTKNPQCVVPGSSNDVTITENPVKPTKASWSGDSWKGDSASHAFHKFHFDRGDGRRGRNLPKTKVKRSSQIVSELASVRLTSSVQIVAVDSRTKFTHLRHDEISTPFCIGTQSLVISGSLMITTILVLILAVVFLSLKYLDARKQLEKSVLH